MKNRNDKLLLYLVLTGVWLMAFTEVCAQQSLKKSLGKFVPVKSFQGDKPSQAVLLNIRSKAKDGEANILNFDQTALQGNKLLFTLPAGETLEALLDEREVRTETDFTWHGHLIGRAGSVVLTVQDGQLAGNFEIKGKNYILSPLGDATSLFYESKNFKNDTAHPGNSVQYFPDNREIVPTIAHGGAIRLLVALTPLVEENIRAMGYQNSKIFLQQAIGIVNQFYINQGMAHRVSLAVAIPVAYAESPNLKQDLSRFTNLTDGFMDDLPAYQKLYNADVSMLLTHNKGSGDLAPSILAKEASCVVNYEYILSNSFFAGEISRLHTNNLVSLQNYAGGQATTNAHPDIIHLTQEASLKGDNAVGVISATTEIVLEPGFEVSENSDLRLEIVPAGSITLPGHNPKGKISDKEMVASIVLPESILKLRPVPTKRILDIEVNLPRTAMAVVDIYDNRGVRIKEVFKGEISQKRFIIDMIQQSEGIYIVNCRTLGQVISKKAVLAR